MNKWFKWFFKTPQRFLGTLIVLGFFVSMVNGDFFKQALGNAISSVVLAFQPMFEPALVLLIVLFALRKMVSGGKK